MQWIWVPANNAWGHGPTVPYAWDSYPLGYYHSPILWDGLPQVIVVEARTYPDGRVAPNVLYDPSTGNWIQTSGAGEPLPPPPPIANLPPPSPPLCASGEIFIPWFEGQAADGQEWDPIFINQPTDQPPPGICLNINSLIIPQSPTNPVNPPPPPPTCPEGTYWDPQSETCKPIPVQPPPPPTCPPGTVWDPVTQTCIPIPPPPPIPQPCQPSGQPGDELTNGMDCINANLLYLQWQLSQLQLGMTGQPTNPDPVTCTQLSGLLNATNAWLYVISQAITNSGSGGGPPINLEPITTALTELAIVANSYASVWNTNTGAVVTGLDNIASAVTNSQTFNCNGIADQLKSLNDNDIAGKDLLDQLVSLGVLDPQVGQILGDPARVRIDPGRYAPETIKVLKYLSTVDTAEANRILAYLKDLLAKIFDWANTELGAFITGTNTPATMILQQLEAPLLSLTTHTSDWIDLVPKSVMQLTETVMENGGPITPDNAEDRGFRAFGFAFLIGQGIHILADLAKFLGYPMSSLWSSNAALLVELLAYDDIRRNLHGPYWEASIGANRKYQVNAKFRPYVPGTGPALGQYARRKITDAQVNALLGYAGVRADYVDSTKAVAFRPLNPRQLTGLYTDAPFNRTEVQTLLEDSGISDANIPTLLDAYEYKSVSSLRQGYVASVIRSSELGTISEAELNTDLSGIGYGNDAINLIVLTIAQKKLDNLLSLYRREIDTLYQTNQLTDAQYLPALETAGMDPDLAQGYYGIASAKLHGKELAAAARAAAKIEAQTIRLNLSTTKSLYLSGQIDDALMAAGVAASGLSIDLIPMTVALFTAEYSAKRVDAFGLLLPRNQAILLREKVAAVKEQYIKSLVDSTYVTNMLNNYAIPESNRDALLSAWTAQIKGPVLVP